ncbi:hypothetical protein A5733_06330 [Mycobacterium sp. NS-7484]|uniref:hypothetical protein n=1 Tax=Mycobacterium sp. NS-7484 TaxID=1834161 RepID=UPI00096E79BB|nr:hypothetical protein [Mycobacterium sp. NS-7484]OMB99196.1 hypothetical protein A5733_06330 [Mycobacterium sp. NS-7484]
MVNHHRKDQRVRVVNALQMRIDGHTWQSIADRTDWETESGVRLAVNNLLDQWESETVDEYRRIQDQRYSRLFREWWPAACNGDEKAAAIVLKTLEALNKLHGLNKEATDNTGAGMTPDQFKQRLAEYVELQMSTRTKAIEQ